MAISFAFPFCRFSSFFVPIMSTWPIVMLRDVLWSIRNCLSSCGTFLSFAHLHSCDSSRHLHTHRRRSKFYGNSVAVKNPTFAYTIIIFIDRTSTYTITFTHHREGRLGSVVGLV